MTSNEQDNYFLSSNPNIYENNCLREPQIQGYFKVYEHFAVKNKKTHAIVVLPTGVGKTGLMGLLPYHICKGKVLIITPQLTIKDTVVDSLDPDNPESFWYKRKVFERIEQTPSLVEYTSDTKKEILDSANMIILNIHKLQARLQTSPLNFLDENYFDMIIIDEAHHSTANSWVSTTNYFKHAKVVKLTGTPIRTDGVELAGELVYKYKLSQAMALGYIKSLRNFEYVPEQLLLTLDNDDSKKYSVEELLQQDIRDEDWIKRSVAYSIECSRSVVDASIRLLEQKRRDNSKVPHKIIAVACSIDHAKQIKELYLERGYKAEVIHSRQNAEEISRIKNDIKNHRIEIIINVAMLGEGYDHEYLSIAAIFRPFKSELPYEQFIGRVLRAIPNDIIEKADDNIADVISHKNLYLIELWEKYKIEIQESEVIKHLQLENILEETDPKNDSQGERIIRIGNAIETGIGRLVVDPYLNTELITKHMLEQEKQADDIKKLQELLSIDYEQALSIYNQTKTKETAAIKRPDLYFSNKKKNLDAEIRDVIVPSLITKYDIDQLSSSLLDCRIFSGRYAWIKSMNNNNGAMLAMYFNSYLKGEIGKAREDWTTADFDIALSKLPVIIEYVEKVLSDYLQN
jgi:superfamily II DNA or RNA helicase